MANLKSKIRIADYVNTKQYKKTKRGRLLKDCPFCEHKWHFILNDNNSYYSCSCCCQGGDSIDFMQEKFGKSYADLLSEYNISKDDLREDEAGKRIQSIISYKRKRYIDKAYDYLERKCKEWIDVGIEGNNNIYFYMIVRLQHLPDETKYWYLRQAFCKWNL